MRLTYASTAGSRHRENAAPIDIIPIDLGRGSPFVGSISWSQILHEFGNFLSRQHVSEARHLSADFADLPLDLSPAQPASDSLQ